MKRLLALICVALTMVVVTACSKSTPPAEKEAAQPAQPATTDEAAQPSDPAAQAPQE